MRARLFVFLLLLLIPAANSFSIAKHVCDNSFIRRATERAATCRRRGVGILPFDLCIVRRQDQQVRGRSR